MYDKIIKDAAKLYPDPTRITMAIPLLAGGVLHGDHSLQDCITPLVVALNKARQSGLLERFATIYLTNKDDSVTKSLADNLGAETFVKKASQNGPSSVKLISGGASGSRPYASPYMDVYATDNALKCDSTAWQRYVLVSKAAPAWTCGTQHSAASAASATTGITGTASDAGHTGPPSPKPSASMPGSSSNGTESATASNHIGDHQDDTGVGRPLGFNANAMRTRAGANGSSSNINTAQRPQAQAPTALVASNDVPPQMDVDKPFFVDKFLFAYERKTLNGKHSRILPCTFEPGTPADALSAKLYIELKCTPRVEDAIKAYATSLETIRSQVATIVIQVPRSLITVLGETALEDDVQRHLKTQVAISSASLTQLATSTSYADRVFVHVCQNGDTERAALTIRQYIRQKVEECDTSSFEMRQFDRGGVFEVRKSSTMRGDCTIVVFNADMTRVPANIYVNSVERSEIQWWPC